MHDSDHSCLPIIHLPRSLNLIAFPAHNPPDLPALAIDLREPEDLRRRPRTREALVDRLDDAVIDAVLTPTFLEIVVVELGDLGDATEKALA